MKTLIHASTALLSLLMASAATAQQLNFWHESVLADFSDAEIASFKTTIKETLDRTPDAEVIEWRSPSGNLAGKIRPRFTYESNGMLCRRTAFQVSQSSAKPRRENYRFDICQGPDGWGVYSTPIQFSGAERESLEGFLRQVLSFEEMGHPISWTGAESGASVVVVLLTGGGGGIRCRDTAAHISNSEGYTVSGRYRFCKNDAGEWQYQPD